MVKNKFIDFDVNDFIYLVIDNKIITESIYQILNIDCETTGNMNSGHTNIYYALLKDMNGDNVFRTSIASVDLKTEKSITYAAKVK